MMQNIRRWLKRHPYLYYAVHRYLRLHPKILVRPDTELLIEGFPRSGNTYTVMAFRICNPEIKLANHMHSAAHVFMARRFGVPTLILLREPEAAIRSLLVRRNSLSAERVVDEYLEFYKGVYPFRDEVIICRFETAVSDFDSVVRAVNQRFNTNFDCLTNNQLAELVFNNIDAESRELFGGEVKVDMVPRPHADKDILKGLISLEKIGRELGEAKYFYYKLLEIAV